jgi:tRNA A-37 threonylcarbamoyl transferase component Bud32
MSDSLLDQLSWIDPIADRFEQAWKAGVRPRLEDYLEAAPPGQCAALLSELLPVELYHRRQQGENLTRQDYQARLPEHWPLIQALFAQMEAAQDTVILDSTGEAAPPLANRCGRYLLHRLHGEGGLGQVWLALDQDLNREVALKALHPQLAGNRAARQRFLREAQVTGQLEHPNIVPVYELSLRPEDGQPFYTMHFVRGQTLRSAVREYHRKRRAGRADPLALPRFLAAFISVCQAIRFAHARGVVHRDLKPDNVMLGSFGEVIVLDWGLARPVEQLSAKGAGIEITPAARIDTTPGCVLGTPAYMAPEQAQGRLDLIDARTDVYGLGTILFEILTGQPPWTGADPAEVVRRIIAEPGPRPRSVEPSIPPALDAICARAMARERDNRYPCVDDLTEDVQRFLADEPVRAYREPWTQRLARWARHHRIETVAVVAALAGILLAAAVANVQLAHLGRQEHQTRLAAEQAQEDGIQMAARFAARTTAREVALRWAVLEGVAADPQLRHLLTSLPGAESLGSQPTRRQLDTWLERWHADHARTTRAASWFLTDAQGRHLARHPAAAKLVGQNFSFRDYFHGGGRDLPEPTPGLRPLRDVYCSIVYESQATGRRLIALSVPVWNDEPTVSERRVLAVLSMTVEVGRFAALHLSPGKDQTVALIDTRADQIEGEARKGLVLHHPHLAELIPDDSTMPVKLPVFRLDPPRIERMERLCRHALEHERRQTDPAWSQFAQVPPVFPGSLDRNYRDPVGGAYEGPWLAAFEPVVVWRPTSAVKDIGWVVVVEERRGKQKAPRPQTPE